MKVLCRMRGVANLQVVFGTQLQESLQTRTGMLRTLPFVAVRQQEHESAHPLPFRLGTSDELIQNRLRSVCKIAKLSFPHDQRSRIGGAISIFEAQNAEFRKNRVDHGETALSFA